MCIILHQFRVLFGDAVLAAVMIICVMTRIYCTHDIHDVMFILGEGFLSSPSLISSTEGFLCLLTKDAGVQIGNCLILNKIK